MMLPGLVRTRLFPLGGALLFPRSQLPLHIFEPRYREMVRAAIDGDLMIGMVQPRDAQDPPALFEIGCLGRIASFEELDDGRFNIVLEGISRFRIAEEVEAGTPYRQADIDQSLFDDAAELEPLASVQRAELEREARKYADALGYSVDWSAVESLDDEMLVNGIAQIAPFDIGSKQALLEANGLSDRADLLVQFMQFQRMLPGGADGPETLQ